MAKVVTDDSHYKAIADTIRNNPVTNPGEMQPKDMPKEIESVIHKTYLFGYGEGERAGYSDGFQEGYDDGFAVGEESGIAEGVEQGKQAEYDRMWNMIQQNGNRTAYEYAFMDWGWEYIRPKYKIVPTVGGYLYTFGYNINLKKVEAVYVDLSQKTLSDTTANGAYIATFMDCTALEEIEDIGMPAGYHYRTFRNCKKLHTIAVVRFRSTSMINGAFDSCESLVNLTIEGTVGQNGLNLQWSTKLSKASIESVVNALSVSESGQSVTLSKTAVNNAFATEEWATIAATKTNWTINLV